MNVKIVERYNTGLAKTYDIDGFVFQWTDWVLCEIEFREGNRRHWAIVSSFRDNGRGNLIATLFNPTYDEPYNFYPLSKLHHFKPVQILERVRELSKHSDDGDGIKSGFGTSS